MTSNDDWSAAQWPPDKIAEWLAMDAEPLGTTYSADSRAGKRCVSADFMRRMWIELRGHKG